MNKALRPVFEELGEDNPLDASTSSLIEVEGTIRIRAPDTVANFVPCSQCYIEIWDSDGSGDHDFLVAGYVGRGGAFEAWLDPLDGTGTIDPYVRVWTENDFLRVEDELNLVYYFSTGKAQEIDCPSTGCDISIDIASNIEDADVDWAGAGWIDRKDMEVAGWTWYQSELAHQLVVKSASASIGMATVVVPADDGAAVDCYARTNSACYNLGGKIMLPYDSATARSVIAHEYGHFAMWAAFDDAWPTNADCGANRPPWGEKSVSLGCSWKEGWATFYSLATFANPVWISASGLQRNFETLPSTYQTGGLVESRVVATLWDLIDSGNDGESADRAFHPDVWQSLVQTSPDNTLQMYHDSWGSSGYCDNLFRTVTFFNTISTTGWTNWAPTC